MKHLHLLILFCIFQSRSSVSLQMNCSRSKNVVSNRPDLDHTVELEPQSMTVS